MPIAAATYITIQSSITAAENETIIRVTNLGDEAAYNIQLSLDINNRKTISDLKSQLGVQEKFEWKMPLAAKPENPGKYPLKWGVITKFLNRAINDKNLIVFGDGTQTRDFLFVKDAALANILALEIKNKIFNIGSEKATSINGLCGEIKRLFNKKIKIIHSKPLEEVKNMYFDISLAKKQLQWQPKTKLEEGIKKTYQNLSSQNK